MGCPKGDWDHLGGIGMLQGSIRGDPWGSGNPPNPPKYPQPWELPIPQHPGYGNPHGNPETPMGTTKFPRNP